MRTILIFILLLIFFSGISQAKLYKWVDENGVTHFSNVAPPSDQDHQVKEEAQNTTPAVKSPGIDHVINSYKMDAIEDKSTEAGRKYDRAKEKTNKEYAEKFKRMMDDRKRDVQHWEAKLRDVKRESYSNQRDHEKKIRHYEKMVADYQSLYEEAEVQYRKHLHGR